MQVLFFGAPWCSACGPAKRVVEKEASMAGVQFSYIDTDFSPETASHHAVRGLPTVVIRDDQGNETARLTGGQVSSGIRSALSGG